MKERELEPGQSGQDLVCACIDCGRDFTITEGEREFYEFKKLSLPKRCPACRKQRKTGEFTKQPQPNPNLNPNLNRICGMAQKRSKID